MILHYMTAEAVDEVEAALVTLVRVENDAPVWDVSPDQRRALNALRATVDNPKGDE